MHIKVDSDEQSELTQQNPHLHYHIRGGDFLPHLYQEAFPFLSSVNSPTLTTPMPSPIAVDNISSHDLFENIYDDDVGGGDDEEKISQTPSNSIVGLLFPAASISWVTMSLRDRIWTCMTVPIVFVLRLTIPIVLRHNVQSLIDHVVFTTDTAASTSDGIQPQGLRLASAAAGRDTQEENDGGNDHGAEEEEEDDLPAIFRPRRIDTSTSLIIWPTFDAEKLLFSVQIALLPGLCVIGMMGFSKSWVAAGIYIAAGIMGSLLGMTSVWYMSRFSSLAIVKAMAAVGFLSSMLWIQRKLYFDFFTIVGTKISSFK